MLLESRDFPSVFQCHAELMENVCRRIYSLPDVREIMLFGSYAKGGARPESDIDLAVFFDAQEDCLIGRYHELMHICANPEADIQAQPFHTFELLQPCGIIDEVVAYGIELRIS